MNRVFLIAFFIALSTVISAYDNPVIRGFYPDPSICRVNDDYYLVNSTFEYFPAIPIFHSKDLVNWEQIGNVLDREEQVNLKNVAPSGGIFAPTIRYYNGLFYVASTNVGNGGNFYVTADNPEGPWSNPIFVKQGGIDPSIHIFDGKTYFLTSYWGRSIQMSEINPKTGEILEQPRLIWNGTGGRYPEGPHLFKKDNYYYLLIAEGGTEGGHMATIARSLSPWGPYDANPANPILTNNNSAQQSNSIQGVGHADFIETPTGEWWAVCLGSRLNKRHSILGRETMLVPVQWEKNSWPIVNGNGSVQVKIEEVKSVLSHKNQMVVEEFDSATIPLNWNYLRNPILKNYSLESRKGWLQLKGTEVTLDENKSPTFIGQRQTEHNFTLTTKFEAQCKSKKDQVGLTIYMNPTHHYDFYVTDSEIMLRCKVGAIDYVVNRFRLKNRTVQLQIQGTSDEYTFQYSYDGEKIHTAGTLDTRYLSTQTAGGFTGVFLSLFAVGSEANGSFDWVKYQI